MKDYNAWESIVILLNAIQWQPIGRKYDSGDRAIICPICRDSETEGHSGDCSLGDAISEIGRMIYS